MPLLAALTLRKRSNFHAVALVFALLLSACGPHPQTPEPEPGSKQSVGSQVRIDEQAYSGSSVNVVAGTRQMLYTHGSHQYAGYYDPNGRVMLARRRLGDDDWEVQRTAFSANTKDAHNSISLIVDGDGYLHLAWGHHDSPLNYSVSEAPGSLSMGAKRSMVGSEEGKVTYPQFFKFDSGDLAFVYRDGASGSGKVVMNYYDLDQQAWSRRQDNLIDGEGERSAYWDLVVGQDDTLYMAWVWRESPDVATNHDLLYAESRDGGQTWQRRNGASYELPITYGRAEVAYEVQQNSNLMNPPIIAVSDRGSPFIASYWSEETGDNPGFHVVHHSSSGWEFVAGPQAESPFTLAGWGTKKPPISRPALLVGADSSDLHLIYRSDDHDGRVLAASLADLANAQWTHQYLTDEPVGAWEPSIDPAQWRDRGQAHLLLQWVAQADGDDTQGVDAPATPISVLMWRPESR